MRMSTMAAAAFDHNRQALGSTGRRSRHHGNFTGWQILCSDMQGNHSIHFWIFHAACFYHDFGATGAFLGRLKKQLYFTRNLVFDFGKQSSYTHEYSGMTIMTAGMHSAGDL